jgi:hypothetical protein
VPIFRLIESSDTLGDPLLFTAASFRIIATRDADPQRIFEANTDFEQVGALLVNVGVLLIPQNVAAFAVENDNALRQHVDGFTELSVRCFGAFQPLHNLVVIPLRPLRHRGQPAPRPEATWPCRNVRRH